MAQNMYTIHSVTYIYDLFWYIYIKINLKMSIGVWSTLPIFLFIYIIVYSIMCS